MRQLLRSTKAYCSLKEDAKCGTLAHTTLVIFPDEVYLRPLLKECAKAIFSAEDGDRTSRLIDGESFADCKILPPAGGKLTAELASQILEESALSAVEGGKKLFVLDAFQTVTPLVQNKLLKLLEEPEEGVYFLIGATAPHPVLPTVRSRAKEITENPFPEALICAALKRNHGGSGQEEAAAASGGIYSVAESLLGGGELFDDAVRFLERTDVAFIRTIGEKRDSRAFLSALRLVLRDALLCRTGREKYAAIKTENISELANAYPEGALLAAATLTDGAERQIKFNANFPQALLALSVEIQKEKDKWQKLS